jgi:hypothetical protein
MNGSPFNLMQSIVFIPTNNALTSSNQARFLVGLPFAVSPMEGQLLSIESSTHHTRPG